MSKWRWGFLIGNLFLILILFFLVRPRPFEFHRQVTTDLPVYGTVPGFALVERGGRTFQDKDLKGKVWIADFIFTRCQGQCPIMSQEMSRLVPRLKDITFVSFSVDPEFDTADVLSRYADSYHADPKTWFFLTGDRRTLNQIASSFHMNEIGEPAFHSLNFVLIDRRGRIRGYYDSSAEENLRQLERDARRLLQKK